MLAFDRLKDLAESRKLSINEVEERVGLGRNTLYSWKKKVPSGSNLTKIADYFNVSVDYLLGRTSNPAISESLDDNTLVAAHMTDGLSEDELKEVQQYIEFLKSKHG